MPQEPRPESDTPPAPADALTQQEAAARVMLAGRDLGAAAVLFHSAVAARMGLTAIEEKALDLILRHGPLTAGELAGHTGLVPSSVTALIDRLARKGFVSRSPDPDDARRVRIAAVPERLAGFGVLFADFVSRIEALNARFSPSELALIAEYLARAAEAQKTAAAALAAQP